MCAGIGSSGTVRVFGVQVSNQFIYQEFLQRLLLDYVLCIKWSETRYVIMTIIIHDGMTYHNDVIMIFLLCVHCFE